MSQAYQQLELDEVSKSLGSCSVEVKYKGAILPLLVIKGNGPNLFGRNWLQYVRIDWKSIHMVSNDKLQNILAKHQNVFGKGLGHFRGYNPPVITFGSFKDQTTLT